MKYYILVFFIAIGWILVNPYQFSVYGAFPVNQNGGAADNGSNGKIILLSQKYKSSKFSDEIVGQVKNVGNGTADRIKIHFSLFDENGELIGSEYTHAEQDFLKPGQKSPFKKFIDEDTGDDVEAFEVSLSWRNSDRTEEYIENVDIENENDYMAFQKPRKLTEEEIEKLGLFER